MTTKDSVFPLFQKARSNWQVITCILVLLGGGGSFAGFQFVTRAQLDESILVSETKTNTSINRIEGEVKKSRNNIVGITATIGLVNKRQIRQIANAEAREETADIEDRTKREREYDRIYNAKMDKLTMESEEANQRAKESLDRSP